MTEQEINIAIAETEGYHWSTRSYDVGWKRPDGTCGGPPDYLHDLNAMHEIEKTLTSDERIAYAELLCAVCGQPEWSWDDIFATAAQRAETFVRLKSLWKD